MSMFVEMPTMISTGDYHALTRYYREFLAVSACGLVINFLSYFVIQVTSSLTLKGMVDVDQSITRLITIITLTLNTNSQLTPSIILVRFSCLSFSAGDDSQRVGDRRGHRRLRRRGTAPLSPPLLRFLPLHCLLLLFPPDY